MIRSAYYWHTSNEALKPHDYHACAVCTMVSKEVTLTVEVVTSRFKQSKTGQSKNTTWTDAKIAACEAVKLGPSKMTDQRSSQFGISLKLTLPDFLTSVVTVLISQPRKRNTAHGRGQAGDSGTDMKQKNTI